MSSAFSVNDAVTGYAAGRVTAAQLVAAVTAEYYRDMANGKRETWRPVMDVIERAHPGIVELKSSDQGPGFDVSLAERPFPKRFEAELRQAVQVVLGNNGGPAPRSVLPAPGLFTRFIRAIRRVFSA